MATQNNPFGGMSPAGAWADAYKYPNPFCDIASVYLPTNLVDAFTWCEFLLESMPPFMAVINRVVSYFLTDIEISDIPDDVREKYEKLFDDKLHMIQRLQDIGKDFFCFSGDTRVYVRDDGLRLMRELPYLGEVEVAAIDGKWHKVKFTSRGVQTTYPISFGNGFSVRATAEHQWCVDTGPGTTSLRWTGTDGLKYWHGVPLVPPPRPEKGHDFWEGALHGAVLGSRFDNDRGHALVAEWIASEHDVSFRENMVEPPDPSFSPEYWYGIFAGMCEVCGYFHPGKKAVFLSDRDPEVLAALKEGFESFGLRCKKPSVRKVWHGAERAYLGIPFSSLTVADFIFAENYEKFERLSDGLRAARNTSARVDMSDPREEEVFCCEEPETSTFILEGGIVTGNCYGNSFVSLYLPFERYLICPDCGTEIHISKIRYDFDAETGRFLCECPKCRKGKVEFKRRDRRLADTSKVNVKRWNPKRIRLKVHPITGEIKYYYKLEEKFVDSIRKGDRFYLDTTPWGFVDTCTGKRSTKESQECLFEFSEGQIYHMRDTVLSGLSDRIQGWGIPPILPYFKLAYYIQLMRRYDEAIALDFIMPFRILFPQAQAPGGQDALTMVSMNTFISAMSQMVEKKRANMTTIEVAPFAIGYQMIGGEAKQLAPKDSIQMAEQELLNAMGFPQELFAGTLSLQAAPVALRLFEREWNPFVDGMNTVLQWMSDQISRYFMWDPATVRLTPVTLADDMEKKGLQMQAAAGQDISKQTAYRAFGINYLQEQERIIREQQDVQKMQEKAMAEAQAQQANGAMGGGKGGGSAEGGGDASGMNGPGGQVGATPSDLTQQAQQLADTLVKDPDPSHVRSVLISLKGTNPTLHAMVRQYMQDLRNQLASQGKQQILAQMRQGG